MYETIYHRPTSVEHAIQLFSTAQDAKFLSGGQTLLPTMKQRLAAPSDVIDLRHIAALAGISLADGQLSIGAAVTHADVAASTDVRQAIPALAELASHIGDPHVRQMGTLGGSVANNDPAADYPAAVVALEATIHTNARSLSASDFFTGLFDTALQDGELITRISFTVPQKAAYAKFANPASRYAMAGVFIARHADNSIRVAVTGAGSDGVFRHEEMESALSANWSVDAISGISVDAGQMLSDIHGSSAYRANLVKVMAKRAVETAH
uniref:FAD binding domain-containing protein n=1 Tax=Pararhizobium sp. IMCC3301 TaxID=3067904 RepID=UPI0027411E10|nr:xanthine dehydrogenase family protein subunit M [Pararhizobium sp. IMCC3301]